MNLSIKLLRMQCLLAIVGVGTSLPTHAQQAIEQPQAPVRRYVFTGSARMPAKGTGYYQATYLLLHTAEYGLNQHCSLGGGIEFVSSLLGSGTFRPIGFLQMKVGTPVASSLYVAGALTVVSNTDFSPSRQHGLIATALVTYGNDRYNLTTNVAWVRWSANRTPDGQIRTESAPVLSLKTQAQLRPRLALVAETKLIPTNSGYMGLYHYALWWGWNRPSVGIGFINSRDLSRITPLGLPYLSIRLAFGHKRLFR